MSEEKEEAPIEVIVPKGTEWTLKLPTDRKDGIATFYLKDVDVDLFIAVKAMIEQDKYRDGINMFFTSLIIEGSDPVSLITTNFITFQAAQRAMMKILEPLPFEVKKN